MDVGFLSQKIKPLWTLANSLLFKETWLFQTLSHELSSQTAGLGSELCH